MGKVFVLITFLFTVFTNAYANSYLDEESAPVEYENPYYQDEYGDDESSDQRDIRVRNNLDDSRYDDGYEDDPYYDYEDGDTITRKYKPKARIDFKNKKKNNKKKSTTAAKSRVNNIQSGEVPNYDRDFNDDRDRYNDNRDRDFKKTSLIKNKKPRTKKKYRARNTGQSDMTFGNSTTQPTKAESFSKTESRFKPTSLSKVATVVDKTESDVDCEQLKRYYEKTEGKGEESANADKNVEFAQIFPLMILRSACEKKLNL